MSRRRVGGWVDAGELPALHRWGAVGGIVALHTLLAAWLLWLPSHPSAPALRDTVLQVDWITEAVATEMPAAPTPVDVQPVPVRPVRAPAGAPVSLLSTTDSAQPAVHATATEVTEKVVSEVPAPVTEAAPPSPPAAAAVLVASTQAAAVAAPAVAAPPKNLPPESVQYLVPPAPVYPRLSRRQGESGRVLVRVYIDEAGLPRTVQISTSSGHARLDDAALQGVLQARFKPYAENGRPTGGWAFIPLTFDLEK